TGGMGNAFLPRTFLPRPFLPDNAFLPRPFLPGKAFFPRTFLPEMFLAFMGQCQLFMAMRPEDFPDDRTWVGFVISLLSGSAAQWATPLLVQNSPLLTDYQGFWQHMRLMYEDPI
uniref:DUF4939 domain-containing protein n=1 Tax=Naja naja TaxID=35670 RepID=A0A8C6Y395_NAJNA